MQISYQSHVGRKRNSNQDYVEAFENKRHIFLAILADGMGGHQAGDVASQMTVKQLGERWTHTQILTSEEAKQWLIKEIQKENDHVYAKGQSQQEFLGMGTTLVAAVLLPSAFVLANIGDSRAYLLRDGKMQQLTEDHSLVNELVKSGEITKEMAQTHPRKNVLTRSLGMPNQIEVDTISHAIEKDDLLLMCSDGLTNMVSDQDIAMILMSNDSLNNKIIKLIDSANEAGGTDNITVLAVDFVENKEEN